MLYVFVMEINSMITKLVRLHEPISQGVANLATFYFCNKCIKLSSQSPGIQPDPIFHLSSLPSKLGTPPNAKCLRQLAEALVLFWCPTSGIAEGNPSLVSQI